MKVRIAALALVLILAPACGSRPISQPTQSPAPHQLVVSPTSPAPAPSSTPEACQEAHGRFEFHEAQTSLMTHPLSFRVYLPPCYGYDPQRRYPALYLLHGQSFTDDQWERLGADEVLDHLVTSQALAPFILVLPKESNYMIDQWTSKFGPAIGEELVPWVDNHYRTCRQRACRAIGGISRGAGWAMRIGLIYWDVFGSIGGHSLAPFRGDFNQAPFWFADIPEDQKPRIWIDAGDRDFMHDPARVFADRLEDYEMPYEWHVFPGAHDERYWAEHMEDYLLWYAQGWPDLD